MHRLVGRAGLIGLALWTVIAGLAYVMVDMVGQGAASVGAVPGFPPEPFTFAWLAARLHAWSLTAVFAGWLLGALLIFGATWTARRFLRPPLPPASRSGGSSIPSRWPDPPGAERGSAWKRR